MEDDKHEHSEDSEAREEPRREIGSAETSMESISGNEIAEEAEEQQQRDRAEPVGQAEDTARLRLMEISKAVPPAGELESNDDGEHSHHESPQNPEPERSPSRPDTEEEIRRKLMSISYSFEQPLANAGQPVVG